MTPIRVLLVADRTLCELIVARLPAGSGLSVVAHRRGDEPWVETAAQHRVDVVVLDLASDPPSWPEALAELHDRAPVRVVVVAEDDEASVVAAARAGAAGWLADGVGIDRLVEAVTAVHRGDAVYPARHLAEVLDRLRGDVGRARRPTGPLTTLTGRELEVLRGLVEGRSARHIAETLDLAVNTVRTHTNRIFRKLGVHGRLEAVRIARAEGLAPADGATGRAEQPVRLIPDRPE